MHCRATAVLLLPRRPDESPSLLTASLSSFPPDRTFCNLIAGGNNALPRPLSLPLRPLSPCRYKKENGRPAETLLNDQPVVLRYTRGRRRPGSVMLTLVPTNISSVFNVQSTNPKKTDKQRIKTLYHIQRRINNLTSI